MSGTLRDFCSDSTMRAAIQAEIARVYDGTGDYYVRPDAGDIVADALAAVRRDLREQAEDQEDCQQVDDCTAQVIVLRALAEWLEVAS